MPCASVLKQWEIRPTSVLRVIKRTRALMWQWTRRLVQACRRSVGYQVNYNGPNQEEQEMVCLEPMGSERMEMRKRQMSVQQESAAGGTAPTQQDQPGQANPRGSNACCFCWCCCCSCSWNEDRDDRNRKASYDVKEGTADCEDCPKPTLEEVRLWGQSFDQLMCCPAGRNSFRQFLRTEFSEENMLFWLACEEFSKEANKSAVEEKARVIYEDYISILSPKEVSLDSRVREAINRNMLEPTSHTFDDAQLQIYTLMQRDSYPRYMNSPAYKNLLNTLSEQSPES
ncbi:regulator of G-protein signaling 20 isoform X1 [Melanotaenia boesemani]|uniref:regulator of G-protein signaling 20 isoform X1 n=2 Tax=Melanotaenia boesemani TaxID=1250792 RepID=UPI001C047E11|nr:regulator of G-protein signaling 20 isoform X1 [Melanotaenia boesemani]XP_041848433.1 regulator of G-protein signaling 20 isoform X1 [Melanotaenia boesemani]